MGFSSVHAMYQIIYCTVFISILHHLLWRSRCTPGRITGTVIIPGAGLPVPVLLMKPQADAGQMHIFSPICVRGVRRDDGNKSSPRRAAGSPSYPTGRAAHLQPGSGRRGKGSGPSQSTHWWSWTGPLVVAASQVVDRHLNITIHH
jgi:hypothetical protein